jgi:hypothetical protein
MPRCASDNSPGRGICPPSISFTFEIVWWGTGKGRVVTREVQSPGRPATPCMGVGSISTAHTYRAEASAAQETPRVPNHHRERADRKADQRYTGSTSSRVNDTSHVRPTVRGKIARGRGSPHSPPEVWTKISPFFTRPSNVMIQVSPTQSPNPKDSNSRPCSWLALYSTIREK